VHAEPSHWLHETFISKTVCQYFGHKNCGTELEDPEITGRWAPPSANCISGKPHSTSSFGCENQIGNKSLILARQWIYQSIYLIPKSELIFLSF
jgi:hypothetical protein